MHDDAFVWRLQPLTAFGPGFEGCIGDAAERCHQLAEVVVEVGVQVVHDVVNLGPGRMKRHRRQCSERIRWMVEWLTVVPRRSGVSLSIFGNYGHFSRQVELIVWRSTGGKLTTS